MSQLAIERASRDDGKTLVFHLRGTLGESSYSHEFLEELRAAVKTEATRFILDLKYIDYMSSMGVGIIAAGYTSACRAGKKLLLVAVPPKVRRVLEICGVLDVVKAFDGIEEASAAG